MSKIETAMAKRAVLEAIDQTEKDIVQQLHYVKEVTSPTPFPEAPHIQTLRGNLAVSGEFAAKTEKRLADFKDESWNAEIQKKLDTLKEQRDPLVAELNAYRNGGDIRPTEDKIEGYSKQVADIYGDVTGRGLQLLEMARLHYDFWNRVSIALFLLALYLKLWSGGLIDGGGGAG